MYKALIVDDEKIEREGVRFLIHQLGLTLHAAEAENGVKALEFLQSNEIDILFTDIRMPFMDGLELTAKAKALYPQLKVIIVSAFGDFEYAKQAIQVQVVHYLLKPVEVSEFTDVVNEVIRLCGEDREQRARTENLQLVYDIGSRYVREQTLLDLLHGARSAAHFGTRMAEQAWLSKGEKFRLILLDMRNKFFDTAGEQLPQQLADVLQGDCLYVNLNEYQSVLFLRMEDEGWEKPQLESYGLKLQQYVKTNYASDAVIVISGLLSDPAAIHNEYQEMEKVLESKFFLPPCAVLYTEASCPVNLQTDDVLEPMLHEISRYINYGEAHLVRHGIERLFELLQGGNRLSTVYVKYICTEIVKTYFQTVKRDQGVSLRQAAEQVHLTQSVLQLKELILRIVEEPANSSVEPSRKVIAEVLEIIHRDYGQDLGLEALAEKAYLSPSYLSHLFKKETGASLVKYITCYRLEKAGELLRTTNMKISYISNEVGYTSFAYFCSIFKSYYGKTPAKYREGD